MIDIQGDRCETCRFYYVDGDNTVCRRLPPAVLLLESKRTKGSPGERAGLVTVTASTFPPMLPSGWCGEFKPIGDMK